jgi:hypothetical protein
MRALVMRDLCAALKREDLRNATCSEGETGASSLSLVESNYTDHLTDESVL